MSDSEPDDALLNEACEQLDLDLVKQLKGGAQKAVHLVQRQGEPFVLKIVGLDASMPDALRRAEREVELLASLDSPHVVKVKSSLIELGNPVGGVAWLEEYLDGEDLQELLFRRQWSWLETAELGRHVALGLGVAHAMKVVHRDLSANNVRRLSSGAFKVLDFGFARHTLRSGLTMAGQPGTFGYASPEHLHSYSGAPSSPSDVFCVGVLMFAALTARLPIPYQGDEAEYFHRLRMAQVDDLMDARPDLAPQDAAVVQRCLHPQPARRYLNGSRLAQALEAVA